MFRAIHLQTTRDSVVFSRTIISMTIGWRKELKCDSCWDMPELGLYLFPYICFSFPRVHDMLRLWKKPCLIVASVTHEGDTPTGGCIRIIVSKCNNMIVSFLFCSVRDFARYRPAGKGLLVKGNILFLFYTYLPFYFTSQWKTLI